MFELFAGIQRPLKVKARQMVRLEETLNRIKRKFPQRKHPQKETGSFVSEDPQKETSSLLSED